jgi:predicted dehydrogenase
VGTAALPGLLSGTAQAAATPTAEQIRVALVGHGMMGQGHLNWLLGTPGVRVTAVCDVDQVRLDAATARVEAVYGADARRSCQAVQDYRKIVDREDVDAVLIATPDHWHALISADAARAGKDVYCEKPISLTIQEGRRLAEVVHTYGCVFQTGTQYRSIPGIRRVCDFVRNGGLGKVRQVFTLWSLCDGSYAPVNPHLRAEPVPEGLDWDLWVGPAPWHDYNSRYHRNPMPGVVPWAFCDDFGAGSITWHHSHSADVVQYALGYEESGPVEVIHPVDGRFPTLTFRYDNGTLHHLVDHWGMVSTTYGALPTKARLAGNFGGVFVGERGWITSMSGGGPIEGGPASIFEDNGHHANWLDAIRTRGRTSTGVEIGHRSASLGHLATIAFKLGRSLRWDPVAEQFDQPEANRLLSRAMREPWQL